MNQNEQKPLRILFIAPRFILPADSGAKIRTLNILKQVAKHCEVDFVCFSFDESDKQYTIMLENFHVNPYLIPIKETGKAKKIFDVLFESLPVSIAKYNSSEMGKRIQELVEANSYDLIHVDHLHMAHYLKYLKNIPAVLDEHNVEYRILERCFDVEKSTIKKAVYFNQAKKMKTFEEKTVKQFSATCCVSEDDQIILSKISQGIKPIHIIPNGVDTELFSLVSARKDKEPIEEEDALVFTGSMDWLPNDDACLYFCRDILPLVWKETPQVKFYIVGKSPSDTLKAFAQKDKRIIVTGRVDDVRDYILRSKVFVVPLRIGGGTRLKILEAMSMQKAIVSTTIGAEGIGYKEESNIVLADTPHIFADKIISLLNNHHQRYEMGERARQLVCQTYDWNIVGQKLMGIYEKIVQERKV
jgi:sugar transferase (PEP-CTERM/EpsH1 system associated)